MGKRGGSSSKLKRQLGLMVSYRNAPTYKDMERMHVRGE